MNILDATGIQDVMSRFSQIFLILALILGFLQCFFGYKWIRAWITVVGFILGFVVACSIAGDAQDSREIALIIGLVSGVVFAVLAFKIFQIGVFIVSGSIAAGIVWSMPYQEGSGWDVLRAVLTIGAFITVGILAVYFARPFIIFVTGIGGAASVVRALSGLVPDLSAQQNGHMQVYLFLAFAVLGILVQFLTTRGEGRKRK